MSISIEKQVSIGFYCWGYWWVLAWMNESVS